MTASASGRSAGDAGRFTPAEIRALAVLVAGGTHEAAATAARKTPRTIRRWTKTERFRTEIAEQSRAILQAAVQRLQAGADRAATALVAMAGGELPPSSSRVAAAKAVIELARSAGELEDLRDQVEQLTERFRARGGIQ